jgi:hypothetical protein
MNALIKATTTESKWEGDQMDIDKVLQSMFQLEKSG